MANDVFNYDLILENYMGEKEVVLDVLNVYKNKVEKQLDKIEQAIVDKNIGVLKFEAHSIKGGSYNVTAKRIGDIAAKMESDCKNNDISNIDSYLKELKEEFKKFVEAIAYLLK